MPKMKVVITGYYDITDDLKDREDSYGTVDIDACADIDLDMCPDELIDYCHNISVTITQVDGESS